MNINNVRAFRFWCQKVLPATYDDSLSYYELLCKITAKLNDIIEAVKNDIGNIFDDVEDYKDKFNKMVSAYNELKEYVDHYFDTLDISEVVNSKLDEMANDGTLDEIINENIFADLNAKFGELETKLNGKMQDLSDKVKNDMSGLASKINNDMAGLTNQVTNDLENLTDTVNSNMESLENKVNADLNDTNNKIDNLKLAYTPSRRLSNTEAQILYGIACSYMEGLLRPNMNKLINFGNSNTPLDNTGVVNELDCSSFTILCLLGYNYERSPFMEGVTLGRGKLGFSREFKPTIRNETGLIRYVYELLMFAEENNQLVKIDAPSDIQTGDVLFFCWNDDYVQNKLEENKTSGEEWWGTGTYKYAAHCGFAVKNISGLDTGTDYQEYSTIGLLHASNMASLCNIIPLSYYLSRVNTQHLYPYVLRPKLNVSNFYVKGKWRFRGLIDNYLNLKIGASVPTFAGGAWPTNLNNYRVDKNTGQVSTDAESIATYFIPYSEGLVVNWDAEKLSPKYTFNIFYYNANYKRPEGVTEDPPTVKDGIEYLGYTHEGFGSKPNCDLVRVSFESTDGTKIPVSDIMVQNMIKDPQNIRIRYATMPNEFGSFENTNNNSIKNLDTVKYFKDYTEIGDYLVMGKR